MKVYKKCFYFDKIVLGDVYEYSNMCDDLLYMNQVKEMIEKWGKEHHEDVSIYLFNHGELY